MSWKPIDTAPKDRRILLWFDVKIHAGACFGRWDDERYKRSPNPHFVASELEHLFGKIWMRENQPTHWDEVPEGPHGEGGSNAD